jgi:DNA-binding NtrC family response regulator
MARLGEAGLLATIADGGGPATRARMRAGARVAIAAADDELARGWARALEQAGARPCVGSLRALRAAPAWAETELLVIVRGDEAPALRDDDPPFVLIGAPRSPLELSHLLRQGLLDVLAPPVGPDALLDACAHAIARAPSRPARPRATVDALPVDGAIGAAIARTRLPVLFVGETGTGKSRLARMLHETLAPSAPFVEVNAAALGGALLPSELFGHERGAFTGAHASKPGLVAVAHGGTLFLDEIGELSLEAQAQLLSYLDTGSYRPVGAVREGFSDARVFCATNRDLRDAIARGRFREDLYYRLASIVVPLRPLRAQRDRIATLARDLARQAAAHAQSEPPQLAPDAIEVLTAHDWPGNVRQLRHVIERAAVLASGRAIHASDIRALCVDADSAGERGLAGQVPSLAEMERELVARAMHEARGNRTKAAQLLGITPRGLYNKLRRGGTAFRPPE